MSTIWVSNTNSTVVRLVRLATANSMLFAQQTPDPVSVFNGSEYLKIVPVTIYY